MSFFLARANLWAKNEQNRFFDLCRCLVHINLVPRVFHLPTPKGKRDERPCSGWSHVLMTNLSSYDGSHVTSAVCYLQNRLSEQPGKANLSISQRRFVMSITLLSTLLSTLFSKDMNIKLLRVIIFDMRHTTCSVARLSIIKKKEQYCYLPCQWLGSPLNLLIECFVAKGLVI